MKQSETQLTRRYSEGLLRMGRSESALSQRFWDRFWSRAPEQPLGNEPSELIAELQCLPRSEMIVDLGTGNGRSLKQLSEIAEKTVAIDFSAAALKRAACNVQRVKSRIEFRHTTCYRSGLADESCSAVLSSDLLNHLDKPILFAKEVFRILRPGGVLVANALSVSDPMLPAIEKTAARMEDLHYQLSFSELSFARDGMCTMKFFDSTGLAGIFHEFEPLEHPSEYSREDHGHPAPFQENPHRHVFWKLLYRRPMGI